MHFQSIISRVLEGAIQPPEPFSFPLNWISAHAFPEDPDFRRRSSLTQWQEEIDRPEKSPFFSQVLVAETLLAEGQLEACVLFISEADNKALKLAFEESVSAALNFKQFLETKNFKKCIKQAEDLPESQEKQLLVSELMIAGVFSAELEENSTEALESFYAHAETLPVSICTSQIEKLEKNLAKILLSPKENFLLFDKDLLKSFLRLHRENHKVILCELIRLVFRLQEALIKGGSAALLLKEELADEDSSIFK